MPAPSAEHEPIGKRVLVALEHAGQAPLGFQLAARVAAPDSGIVRGLLRSSPTDALDRERDLVQLRTAGFAVGLDTDPALLVHGSLEEGVINTVATHHPSFVIITQRSASAAPALGTAGEALAATLPSPVAIVVGEVATITEVQLVETHAAGDPREPKSVGLAEDLASRIGGKKLIRNRLSEFASRSVSLRPPRGRCLLPPIRPPAPR